MEKHIPVSRERRRGHDFIRDTKISVNAVLGWLASGMSSAEIITEHPELVHDDLLRCLSIAARQRRRSG